MNKRILIACAVFAVLSCKKQSNDSPKPVNKTSVSSSDSNLTPDEISSLQFAAGKNRIKEEEAQSIALNFMSDATSSDINNARMETNRTISLASKKVVWQNVASTISNAQGRLQTDSIPLYVYQFETPTDSTAGFAIVSGDTRLPRVLVCTTDGAVSDTAKATGAQNLLANIPAYIESEINRQREAMQANLASALDKIKNQLPDSIKQKIDNEIILNANMRLELSAPYAVLQNVVYGNFENIVYIPSLIPTKWGQDDPFNLQVPLVCGTKRAPTGCQATAMAQIMAYYRYPASYAGITLYWKNILEKEDLPISTLFNLIGQLSNMNYGCSGSGTSNNEILFAYYKMGYKLPQNGFPYAPWGSDQVYDIETIKNSLFSRMPVHVTGCDASITSCHAWIIDGYLQRRVPWAGFMVLYINNTPIRVDLVGGYLYDEFLLCNFGWDGYADGFYVSGIFNTGRQDLPNHASPSAPSFVSRFKIIPNIHP